MKQTKGRDKLGKLAPKFAELNDDVLFQEEWIINKLIPNNLRLMSW